MHSNNILRSYLDARDMSIYGLHALRMIMATVAHSSIRGPHCESPTVVQTSRSIAIFRCLIYHLW